jgi:hypothetical protein
MTALTIAALHDTLINFLEMVPTIPVGPLWQRMNACTWRKSVPMKAVSVPYEDQEDILTITLVLTETQLSLTLEYGEVAILTRSTAFHGFKVMGTKLVLDTELTDDVWLLFPKMDDTITAFTRFLINYDRLSYISRSRFTYE